MEDMEQNPEAARLLRQAREVMDQERRRREPALTVSRRVRFLVSQKPQHKEELLSCIKQTFFKDADTTRSDSNRSRLPEVSPDIPPEHVDVEHDLYFPKDNAEMCPYAQLKFRDPWSQNGLEFKVEPDNVRHNCLILPLVRLEVISVNIALTEGKISTVKQLSQRTYVHKYILVFLASRGFQQQNIEWRNNQAGLELRDSFHRKQQIYKELPADRSGYNDPLRRTFYELAEQYHQRVSAAPKRLFLTHILVQVNQGFGGFILPQPTISKENGHYNGAALSQAAHRYFRKYHVPSLVRA